MNEKPIERLSYYNGQRLEADDLKLEQEYHIRVRRWLNKSLFSAGIAEGLEVRAEVNDLGKSTNRVIVSPGLALDSEGREIILLEETPFEVVGRKSPVNGQVEGNYLAIQYREETRAEASESCTPRKNGHNKGQLAWGGPSRVRATPILSLSDGLPHESSGKIVLAQVELENDCTVLHVYTYPRHYVGPTSISTVRQYALEGERHIDENNPGRIYFHIRGRQPNAMTLYLRAEEFSTLYYTELGQHLHGLQAGTMEGANPPLNQTNSDHNHLLTTALTKDVDANNINDGTHTNHKLLVTFAGAHSNTEYKRRLIVANDYGLVGSVTSSTFVIDFPVIGKVTIPLPPVVALIGAGTPVYNDILPVLDAQGGSFPDGSTNARISEGAHRHGFDTAATTDNNYLSYDHKHDLRADGSIGIAGVSDISARSEPDPNKAQPKALAYVDNLQVYIGKVDSPPPEPPNKPPNEQNRTHSILTQLNNAQPSVGWLDNSGQGVLGDGKKSHPLAQKGTGPIRLDLLSSKLGFPEGEYYIELRVEGAGNGGRILYNLYVE